MQESFNNTGKLLLDKKMFLIKKKKNIDKRDNSIVAYEGITPNSFTNFASEIALLLYWHIFYNSNQRSVAISWPNFVRVHSQCWHRKNTVTGLDFNFLLTGHSKLQLGFGLIGNPAEHLLTLLCPSIVLCESTKQRDIAEGTLMQPDVGALYERLKYLS